MTGPSDSPTQAAVQFLIWALEEIEKGGNAEAEEHVRAAIEAMQKRKPLACVTIRPTAL
jgi:hypothetical protein